MGARQLSAARTVGSLVEALRVLHVSLLLALWFVRLKCGFSLSLRVCLAAHLWLHVEGQTQGPVTQDQGLSLQTACSCETALLLSLVLRAGPPAAPCMRNLSLTFCVSGLTAAYADIFHKILRFFV